ncbi:hypothetical protein D9M68_587170 [compost metagenome]
MLIARVEVVEEQEEPGQAAIHIGCGEVEGVVVVEQRAQCLARVANTILELIEAGVDVAVVVILELARRRQRGAGFDGAVVVARESIALRPRMSVVQVGGNFRRTEADVILGQRIMDAQDHGLPIARENGWSWRRSARRVAFIAPNPLGWISRVEHPIRPLLGP